MTANAIKIEIVFAANEINVGKNLYKIKPTITIKIMMAIMTDVVSLLMVLSLMIYKIETSLIFAQKYPFDKQNSLIFK